MGQQQPRLTRARHCTLSLFSLREFAPVQLYDLRGLWGLLEPPAPPFPECGGIGVPPTSQTNHLEGVQTKRAGECQLHTCRNGMKA
eukprot:4258790-Alexandrium_andersonii.AAC.1